MASTAVLPASGAEFERSSIAMENGALHLAHKDGVITVGHLADEFTLDTAQGVIEDRQPQFAQAEGAASKRPPTPFCGLKKTAARSF